MALIGQKGFLFITEIFSARQSILLRPARQLVNKLTAKHDIANQT